MRNVPAATAATSGNNKGKVPSFSWLTGITADQNVTGLPLHAKGTAILEVAGDQFTIEQFDTVEEVKEAAGEHLDSYLLEVANRDYRAVQLAERTKSARKLTLAPANILDWVRSFTVAASSVFAPAVKAEKASAKKAVAAQFASVAATVDSMTPEEMRAFILAASARLNGGK